MPASLSPAGKRILPTPANGPQAAIIDHRSFVAYCEILAAYYATASGMSGKLTPACDHCQESIFRHHAKLYGAMNSITTVFADGGYTEKPIDWAKEMFGCTIKVVKLNELKACQILPKPWIGERTFAWLNRSRRLFKDTNSATHRLNPSSTSSSDTSCCAALLFINTF
jgi:transposase